MRPVEDKFGFGPFLDRVAESGSMVIGYGFVEVTILSETDFGPTTFPPGRYRVTAIPECK